MLDKSKLGNRYSCFACGTKFYDLNRSPATCPECSASQEDAPARDKVREALGRGQAKTKAVAVKAEKEKNEKKEAENLEIEETDLEAEDMEGMEGMEDMEGMHLVDEDGDSVDSESEEGD